MDDIFKVLIQIFSSENMTTDYLQAIDSFQKLIHERPKLRDEVIEILNKPKDFAYATTNDENNEHDDADPDADVDEQDTAKNSNENSNDDFLDPFEFESKKTNFVIRDESPFTNHFQKIYNAIELDIIEKEGTSEKENPYFFSNFVDDVLLKRFLPYAFIWSSLTLRDPSYIMNRWTNGTVEKFIGTRKKAGKNIEPAEYIIKSQKSALANCREYIALQEQSNTKKQIPKTPSKTPQKTSKTPTKTPSKTPKKVKFDTKDEEPKNEAISTWSAKKQPQIIVPANHSKLAYSYQNPKQLNLIELKQPSSLISKEPIVINDKSPDVVAVEKTYKYPNIIIELPESHLKRLTQDSVGKEAWLSDTLLEILSRLLVKGLPQIKLNDCYFMTTAASTKLFNDGNTENLFRKLDLDSFKYIIGFYELDQHWRLCFANNSTRTFYYIDPFSALKTIQNNKLKIWSTFASNKSSSNTKWSLGVFKHSKQTDCYNCGTICLLFLEKLLMEEFICDFDNNFLIDYRKKLYDLLIRYEKK